MSDLCTQVHIAMQKAAALERQRQALCRILANPEAWPGPIWHWAYSALKSSEPGDYRLLFRLTDRRAAFTVFARRGESEPGG